MVNLDSKHFPGNWTDSNHCSAGGFPVSQHGGNPEDMATTWDQGTKLMVPYGFGEPTVLTAWGFPNEMMSFL